MRNSTVYAIDNKSLFIFVKYIFNFIEFITIIKNYKKMFKKYFLISIF